MKHIYKLAFISLSLLAFAGCRTNEDDHHFDNKLYIQSSNPVDEVLFTASSDEVTETRELTIGTPIPVESEVSGKFVFDASLLNKYNMAYGQNAELLPKEMINIAEPSAVIEPGSVQSSPVTVEFKGIQVLSREKLYVAPVSLTDIKGIDVLDSKTVMYYVFKGASLINVVADIKENYFPVEWKSDVSNLETITFEALIRARTFGAAYDGKSFISTLFGIEGEFLVRIGDASFPDNQIQVVNPNGNFPSGDSALGLPVNEWIHVAVVWDAKTGDRIVYHNGLAVAKDSNANGSIDLSQNCYIGYSYESSRWFDGEVSEMRIWSVNRKSEELINNMYTIDPKTEGLIAYWKFNEGAGATIIDQTGNGNDITAKNPLTWTSVSLPE